ncbi:MAG: helix-turn-helix domain-containing protein [Nannocystaceae bacterium]
MRLTIETFNLEIVERTLCVEALNAAGTIIEAARLLGITRHSLKRRIVKHNITWPVRMIATAPGVELSESVAASSPPSTTPAPARPTTATSAAASSVFGGPQTKQAVIFTTPRILRD